jgi:hypothetical protein
VRDQLGHVGSRTILAVFTGSIKIDASFTLFEPHPLDEPELFELLDGLWFEQGDMPVGDLVVGLSGMRAGRLS